jgi:hypothetical protein
MTRFLFYILLKNLITLSSLIIFERFNPSSFNQLPLTLSEMTGVIIYTSFSSVIWDLIILIPTYILLLKKINLNNVNPFVIGVILHLPITLIMLFALEINLNLFISNLVGLIGAGITYYKLFNHENQINCS